MLSETFKSSDVKEILERKFPNNIFRIRTKRNIIVVYTDLVVNIPSEYQNTNWRVIVAGSRTDEDMRKSKLYEKMFRQNMEMEDEITNIVRKHVIKESVQVHTFYVNIEPIENYKMISKRK